MKKNPQTQPIELDKAVAGYATAFVVYFDKDIKGQFGKSVKALVEKHGLETVKIAGNMLIVSEGDGPVSAIRSFKKSIGL